MEFSRNEGVRIKTTSNSRDPVSRSPGQTKLLGSARLQNNPKIGDVIRGASSDDLEWFVQMMEYQLEETPNWIKDEQQLHEIQAWTRRIRTLAASTLHNKRTVEHNRERSRRLLRDLAFLALGALVAWALTFVRF